MTCICGVVNREVVVQSEQIAFPDSGVVIKKYVGVRGNYGADLLKNPGAWLKVGTDHW